ncbi:LCP family protein [Phycicoccus sonneratiae]|uniref:LCP family protein n=1 Tax=Phycicoccus sonneratiae TaxID=2807628 RepID=A0ABS2CNL9_9MICO|nr:LCP family protein [Phycicoccus sonneraticus]MBM6401478.1 LCP family protein [Phycicoccus sonneraticus]
MRMRPTAVLAVVLLAVAGCSGDPEPTTTTSASSTSATPTPTPDVVVEGADAELTAAVAKVYAGKTGIEATATLGTWKKEKVAVVTSGDDVTLAVGPDWKVVGGWWPSLDKPTSLGKGPRFVLVIGSDARPNKTLKGTRGDTLQVLGVDGKGGGGVMGMARDIWAPMPGGGNAKINAAFAYGGGKGQVDTVRKVTGLPIEGYVVTGFGGFGKIVNESGGLPMTVAKKVVLQGKTTVKAGKQILSGKFALAYARERKSLPDGDFGRSAHQSELLLAAAVAARVEGVKVVPKEMSIVSKYAETDLSAADALTFVASFYKLDPTKVGHTVAKGGFGTSPDGQSIVVLDAASKKAFASFKDGRL